MMFESFHLQYVAADWMVMPLGRFGETGRDRQRRGW